MALVQDTTVRFMDPPTGQNFTFKLSKPLNQITLEDIKTQDSYVGFTNFGINTIGEGVLSQGSPVNNPNHCFMWATDESSLYSDINAVGHWCTPASFPTGVYMRNILIYAPLTVGNNGSFLNTDDKARIVLDITPDANTTMQKLAIGDDSRVVCYFNNDTQSEPRVDNYYYIYPAVLFDINSTTYIYIQELFPRWGSFYIDGLLDQGFFSGNARVNFANESYHRLDYGWTVGATTEGEPFFTKFTGEGNTRQIANYQINGHEATFEVTATATNYHWRVIETLTDNEDQTITKQYRANTGFRFKIDNVWYKPIITGGVVTGYTDDMEAESEWDTWTTAKGHNVPVGPPTPGPDDLEDDDQTGGGDYGAAQFLRMYVCTSAELKNLQAWMSGGAAGTVVVDGVQPETLPEGFNPMEQVVGLIGYPIEISSSELDATAFTFKKADGTIVNTGWGTRSSLAAYTDIKVLFGSVDVPAWEGSYNKAPFLDYSATVECYLPFCGVLPLDPQSVMGCTLTAEMYIDYTTGDCSAIVYSNINNGKHVVAMASGNCGSAHAMSATAFGTLMGARAQADHKMTQAIVGGVKNLVTGTVNSAVTGYTRGAAGSTVAVPYGQSSHLANAIQAAGGSMGFRAGAIGGAISGAVDLGVDLTLQNLDNKFAYEMSKNSLGTSISGSFGQQSSWHFPNIPYIKVTYPTPISNRLSTGDKDYYGSTYGVPVHKTGTVGGYTGYTVCNNVDVTGITGATAEEQSMIKQFLETGVYINGGEE